MTIYWPLARLAALLESLGFTPESFPLRYYRDKSFYVMLLFAYLILRGVFDPLRRSDRVFWWGNQPLAMPIAFGLGIVLDAAKTLGGLAARQRRLREGRRAT